MAAFKFDINYPGISVYKALTNKELTEEEKAEIIAEAIESISKEFPNLKNVATKQDITELELKLTKEIKELEKEIKNLDIKAESIRADLTKEIEQVRSDLTKEIEQVRSDLTKDIEQVRSDLTKEIEQVRSDLTKEIEQVRSDLTKEIEKVRTDLTREIEQVRLEIKDVELKLTEKIENSKTETIKWVSIMMIGQVFTITGIILGIFKFLMH